MDVRDLLEQVAAEEAELPRFVAPRVRGGQVRTRVSGLVYTFKALPRDFEGWGVFRPRDARTARLEEPASLPQVEAYMARLASVPVRLVQCLGGSTWVGFPANESDARQRLGKFGPRLVRLVGDGLPFDQVTCGWDGQTLWFHQVDRRADPVVADRLREAVKTQTPPAFKGCTPEMKAAYSSLIRPPQIPPEEQRLRAALATGGGELRSYVEAGDHWRVEWTDSHGEDHVSAISKDDLTVLSAGICLSGEDEKFDLASLVGVVEGS